MASDRRDGEAAGELALLQLIRDCGPLTRAKLAALTGCGRSTIAQRLDGLLRSNLVVVAADATSTGGRPPERIAFNASAGVVLAACLGASSSDIAVLDLAGDVLAVTSEAHDLGEGPTASLEWLADRFAALLQQARRHPRDIWGVGVGLPGPVDFAGGRPIGSPALPGWDDFGVADWLSARYQRPALVDNDANMMALGARASSWSGVEHLVFIRADTGIGAGLIVGGELHRGADGLAGDLGHIYIPGYDHVLCACGNTSCLDVVASGRAIAGQLTRAGLPAAGARDVAEHARAGDPRAIHALRDAGRNLGYGLAGLLNAFNPDMLVIGGALAGAGGYLLTGVREVVYRRSPPMATSRLGIVGADDALHGMIGAASLVTTVLLGEPSPAALEYAA